jgi:hypothetical protein
VTPQLERLRGELDDARRRAHEIAGALASSQSNARPGPDDWSVAECLAHLNLTSRAFLPLLDEAISRGRAAGQTQLTAMGPRGPRPRRYRMDFVGRMVWLATTLRVPVKTTEPFVPAGVYQSEAVLVEFDVLHREIVGRMERADGLDLTALRIVSPFDARLRYNVYAAFKLIAAHQRLHLGQAERAARRLTEVAEAAGVV